jgi:2-aminoethylphosphonate-pyruvate transaminase
MSHRESDFADLLIGLRKKLVAGLGLAASHEAIIVTGSGTAADEMAISNFVPAGRSLLIVNNGVYGARLIEMARANAVAYRTVEPPGNPLQKWSTPIDPADIAALLKAHREIGAVACVHHETTTGLINPIDELAIVAKDAGVLLIADSISATANERPDLAIAAPDVITGSSNKGLHGLPGVSFLLCSEPAIVALSASNARKSVYLDAFRYLQFQRDGVTPFTPAIQVLYALDEALDEMEDQGGYKARVSAYERRANIVRAGFNRLGLEALVAAQNRSASVTTLRLPRGLTYSMLHDRLKRRRFVIYAGQGQLSDQYFRICTFGHLPDQELLPLEESLASALNGD